MESHRLRVDGMSCTGCEATIKSEVQSLGNASGVEADHEAGTVSFVASDSAALRDVERTIEDLGYEVAGRDSRTEDRTSSSPSSIGSDVGHGRPVTESTPTERTDTH